MAIKYRVISIDEKESSFVVRYFTDLITEEELNSEYDIDGNVIYNSNGYPLKCRTDYNLSLTDLSQATKENIHRQIVQAAPVDWLKNAENIKNGKKYSLSNVNILLSQVGTISDEEYEKLFNTSFSLEDDENFVKAVSNVVNSVLSVR